MLSEIIGVLETMCATCRLMTTFTVTEIQSPTGQQYDATCNVCHTTDTVQRTPWSEIRAQLARAREYGHVPYQPVDFLPLNIEHNRIWISQAGSGYLDCDSCHRLVRHQVMRIGDLFKASSHLRCTACAYRKDFPSRTWSEIATEQDYLCARFNG